VPKGIFVDEFHLTIIAPRGLPEEEYDMVRRTLDRADFRRRLGLVVRKVFRRYSALAIVRVTISR
jgi:hypothetical protein